MVSLLHSVAAQSDFDQFFSTLAQGLDPDDAATLRESVAFAWEVYGTTVLGSGEGTWSHALGMAVIIAGLKLDVDSRMAAVLFAIPAMTNTASRGSSSASARRRRTWSSAFRG
jgi:GTP pyrophosphokinase